MSTSTVREHSTSYARITETEAGSNVFEMFIGKQGANGSASFTASLGEENKWTVTDTRDKSVTTYLAKGHGGGNTQDTAKIAASLIDQIVKKFMTEAVVKTPKAKVVKEPKPAKEPKLKAAKAAKTVKGKSKSKDVPDMVLEASAESDESAQVDIADGEQAIAYKGKKFSYEVKETELLKAITVENEGQTISTTINPDGDVLATVKELAMRICNDYTAGQKASSKRK